MEEKHSNWEKVCPVWASKKGLKSFSVNQEFIDKAKGKRVFLFESAPSKTGKKTPVYNLVVLKDEFKNP